MQIFGRRRVGSLLPPAQQPSPNKTFTFYFLMKKSPKLANLKDKKMPQKVSFQPNIILTRHSLCIFWGKKSPKRANLKDKKVSQESATISALPGWKFQPNILLTRHSHFIFWGKNDDLEMIMMIILMTISMIMRALSRGSESARRMFIGAERRKFCLLFLYLF